MLAHPALIDEAMLDRADALILFGSRETWLAEEENRLVEAADWVIDCRDGGPSVPVRAGRLFDLSCFSLNGLGAALRQALNGEVPSPAETGFMREPVAVTTTDGRPLRVLVAEDNVVNGQLFAEQLQMLGCDASVVASGREALDAVAASGQPDGNGWDVLLTDLNMPGMSGYALAEAVLARQPALPVVAVTAHATDAERARCIALGIARVAIKPLSLAQLRDVLIRTVGARAGGMARPSSVPDDGSGGMLGGKAIPPVLHATFVTSCTQSLADLRAARKLDDAGRVAATLHSLTGALGVFGYAALAAQSRELMDRIRASDNLTGNEAALDAFEHALMTVA